MRCMYRKPPEGVAVASVKHIMPLETESIFVAIKYVLFIKGKHNHSRIIVF